MIRALIVDDHPVVQKGLVEILTENFDNIRIEGIRTGRQFMESIKQHDYDIVFLDISLPDSNGLDILRDIRKRRPNLPILVISVYPEELYAIRAIKTGARGYLTKQCEPEELVAAVNAVMSGKKYINPRFAGKMITNFESCAEKPAHEKLSNMEFQVMRMFGSGKSIKDIARELNLSINSIRAYRLHIMEKIGVKGMEGLIVYALRHGITEYKNG
ncbi:MAG: bacterial regulatory s, luxR family protein [Deltaproteobacteria bacterium]|nr:bacterial regulatory s, luxR family protein [Deltaproteobacteria bacterium]